MQLPEYRNAPLEQEVQLAEKTEQVRHALLHL